MSKTNYTLGLSEIVSKAINLRSGEMGLSRSSWLELLLRRELRNEIAQIEQHCQQLNEKAT